MPTAINENSINGVSNFAADVSFTVLSVVLSVVVLLLLVWLVTKFIKRPKYSEVFGKRMAAYEALSDDAKAITAKPQPFSFVGILFAIIGVGILVRFVFVFTTMGYRPEFFSIVDNLFLTADPRAGFTSAAITHYPITTYIYSFFGLLVRAFGLTATDPVITLFINIPLILADVGLMIIVYKAAKKYANEYIALIAAGFIAIFPPFIMISSAWGSIMSIGTMLLVLTFYLMAQKKTLGVFIVFTIALLTFREALFFFPIVAVFVIYQFIKAIKLAKKERVKGTKAIWQNKNTRAIITTPIYIVSTWLASWLISLPLIHNYSFSPFNFTYMIYFHPLANFSFFGFNSLGIYNFFVGLAENGSPWTQGAGLTIFLSILFAVIITALIIVVYISRKNRALLVFLAAFSYLTLNLLFIDFGALDLIIVISLMLLSFILIKDKRIILSMGALGIILTLNISFIFLSSGYLNNLPFISDGRGGIAFDGPGYTGSNLLGASAPGWLAANIVLTALTLLVFIYVIVTLLDMVMANKRKPFASLEKPTFFTSIRKFFRN